MPFRSAGAACLLGAVLWIAAHPAAGQETPSQEAPGLKALDYDARTYVPPARSAAKAPTAQIIVEYTGFTPEAQAAFAFAAAVWETHLDSPVPILVEARFAPLEETTLGSAGPNLIAFDAGDDVEAAGLSPFIWYPTALAEAALGENVNDERIEIAATFNSDFDNWYFGTDGLPPPGTFDFVTVVLHELGHGLGFTGSFRVDDGIEDDAEGNGDECPGAPAGFGCWGRTFGLAQIPEPGFPFVYDLFTEDAAENPLLDTSVYPNPSLVLGQRLTSDAVFFDGVSLRPVNADVPVDLFAPSNFEPGSSFSHLDEQAFPAGHPSSLMTPGLARAEAIHSPGAVTCGIFFEIGWPLGPDCQALLDAAVDTEAAEVPDAFQAEGPFPNPFREATALALRVPEAQTVRADVFDATGRRVATLLDGRVAAGARLVLRFEGAGLPAGLYFIRLAGERFAAVRTAVRVR